MIIKNKFLDGKSRFTMVIQPQKKSKNSSISQTPTGILTPMLKPTVNNEELDKKINDLMV